MLDNFLFILGHVLTPIFIQIGAGYLLNRYIGINGSTLAKVQFYVFIPALLFITTYESNLSEGLLLSVSLQTVLLFALLYVSSLAVSKLLRMNHKRKGAFVNSVCLYNSGNYCIPLVQLLFNNPMALSVQAIVMMVQSIATNTIGVFNSSTENTGKKQALMSILKVPMIYSIIAAFLLKGLSIPLWEPLHTSMTSLGQGLVPMALVTLGAQLSETRIKNINSHALLSIGMRLVLSPLLGFLLILLTGIEGIAAQVIVIAAGAPTAVNSVLLAIQYDTDPEFASQCTFLSTVLSPITISTVILLARNFL